MSAAVGRDLHATHHQNEEALEQAKEDLDNAEGRHPRVANRHSPISPRNLEDNFVFDYDGHDVFSIPFSQTWPPCSKYSNISLTPLKLPRPVLTSML